MALDRDGNAAGGHNAGRPRQTPIRPVSPQRQVFRAHASADGLTRRQRHRQAGAISAWEPTPRAHQVLRCALKRLRLAAGPASLAVLLPLQGCGMLQPPQPRQTLHVLVVPTERIEWMRDDIRENEALQTLVAAFQRLRPQVAVSISIETKDRLAASLRRSNSRGLGPDLILVRAPEAVSLLHKHLVDPLPRRDPRLTPVLELLTPGLLHRVSTPQGIAGLPVFSEFTLACYDRRRLDAPPTTLADLLDLAASGRSVGLSVDPPGIWWTVGALGAETVMGPLVTGRTVTPQPTEASQRALLNGWLSWLRQAALQSRVEIASGPRDLTTGLESGRFAWIPCFSLTLVRLNHTMGRHLGVAPLPSGPAGPATPFNTSRVWALGRDSSPQQRQLALELAALSLNPMVQRNMMLQTRVLLPANRYVSIPVSSSGQLAVLSEAQRQFEQDSTLVALPFSIDQLDRLLPSLETLLLDVMVGAQTPEQGSGAILRLRQHSTP